jgi:hypothetical protein
MPGPMPKRSEERTRRNKPENEGGVSLSKGERVEFKVPRVDSAWHPRAKQWYRSLSRSGMRDYYELSDYETARILCDALTEYYKRPSAMMLATILQGMTALGTTEGERRRMRIELESPKELETPASVTALKSYREQLGVPETR